MAKQSKRYREAAKKVEPKQLYGVPEAVKLLKSMPRARFDESVEICVKLGIDPKQPEQGVRGAVVLPKGTGRTMRVIVFAEGEAAEKARAAGAEEVGSADLVKKITDGWTDFDVAVAEPQMMRHVGRLGKVLGPKGLMPSPKAGTVTEKVWEAVKEIKAGRVEFRSDSGGNVHVAVGKLSFSEEDLVENISAFLEHVRRSKPAGVKGNFIQKAILVSTMGPGVRLAGVA